MEIAKYSIFGWIITFILFLGNVFFHLDYLYTLYMMITSAILTVVLYFIDIISGELQ